MASDKNNNVVYDQTLVLLAPVIAIAITEGMDEQDMSLFGSFISAVASSIFLLIASKGGENLES